MPAFRPTRPTFIGHNTATHSIASGFQTLPVDVVDFDDASGYSAGVYTCDRDGLWLAMIFASRDAIATAAKPFVRILQNAVSVGAAAGVNRTEGQGVTGVWLFHAAAGDALTPQVNLSGTLTVTLRDDARVFITRVGPKSWNF